MIIPRLREISGFAAPLPLANVDTDKIIPAAFLKTVERKGLGAGLFHALRFTPDGALKDDFILNRSPWDKAVTLVARENFGSGSSREHAPWALADFGIRAIVAPSFADIFRQNCIKNGMLPAVVEPVVAERLLALLVDPRLAELSIDVAEQSIRTADGAVHPFAIDEDSKHRLLSGQDDIGDTLSFGPQIEAFFASRDRRLPWLRARRAPF